MWSIFLDDIFVFLERCTNEKSLVLNLYFEGSIFLKVTLFSEPPQTLNVIEKVYLFAEQTTLHILFHVGSKCFYQKLEFKTRNLQ